MILSAFSFALCGASLVLCAGLAWREDPNATVAVLFDRLMSDRVVRLAVLVMWWWLGWHFLAGRTVDSPGMA